MSLSPIGDAFNDYMATVYPGQQASDGARDELKQAFYGAVQWLLNSNHVTVFESDEAASFARRVTSDLRTYAAIRKASLARRAAAKGEG